MKASGDTGFFLPDKKINCALVMQDGISTARLNQKEFNMFSQ